MRALTRRAPHDKVRLQIGEIIGEVLALADRELLERGISGACQGVSQVVRVLAGDMSERRAGETIGGVVRQGVRHRDSTGRMRAHDHPSGT